MIFENSDLQLLTLFICLTCKKLNLFKNSFFPSLISQYNHDTLRDYLQIIFHLRFDYFIPNFIKHETFEVIISPIKIYRRKYEWIYKKTRAYKKCVFFIIYTPLHIHEVSVIQAYRYRRVKKDLGFLSFFFLFIFFSPFLFFF